MSKSYLRKNHNIIFDICGNYFDPREVNFLEDTFMKIVTQIQPYLFRYASIFVAYSVIRTIPSKGKNLTDFEKILRGFSKYSLIGGSIILIIELINIMDDL